MDDPPKAPEIHIHDSVAAMAEAFAAAWCKRAAAAINERGRFTCALTGGSTARALYQHLGSAAFQPPDNLDWGRISLFWGDERTVGPDHPDSNFGMARDAWLGSSRIPQGNQQRLRGEAPDLVGEAERYADLIVKNVKHNPRLPGSIPSFDLILLGMGDDGHVASLFPGTAALDAKRELVVLNTVPVLGTRRLTFTLPLINAAHEIWFIVDGERKARRVAQALGRSPSEHELPAGCVRPPAGRVMWWLDRAAGGLLEESRPAAPPPL